MPRQLRVILLGFQGASNDPSTFSFTRLIAFSIFSTHTIIPQRLFSSQQSLYKRYSITPTYIFSLLIFQANIQIINVDGIQIATGKIRNGDKTIDVTSVSSAKMVQTARAEITSLRYSKRDCPWNPTVHLELNSVSLINDECGVAPLSLAINKSDYLWYQNNTYAGIGGQ